MNLTDHFLVAMPGMDDPFFSGSVVYLCRHDSSGALGVVINKPSPVLMDMVFSAVSAEPPEHLKGQWVMMGGPVQVDRGFVVHSPIGHWNSSLPVNSEIALTTSRDIIEELAQGHTESRMLLTIGCARWENGQLEQELADNAWLTVAADAHILFDVPHRRRYRAALAKLGIDETVLMNGAGHA